MKVLKYHADKIRNQMEVSLLYYLFIDLIYLFQIILPLVFKNFIELNIEYFFDFLIVSMNYFTLISLLQ